MPRHTEREYRQVVSLTPGESRPGGCRVGRAGLVPAILLAALLAAALYRQGSAPHADFRVAAGSIRLRQGMRPGEVEQTLGLPRGRLTSRPPGPGQIRSAAVRLPAGDKMRLTLHLVFSGDRGLVRADLDGRRGYMVWFEELALLPPAAPAHP